MARLQPIQSETASGRARELLHKTQARFKTTPNMARVMANSPAVLDAYLLFEGALSRGALHPRLREQIAVEIAEQDSCQYCLSAHTAIGKQNGLTESEIEQARDAKSSLPREAAALAFARAIVAQRGQPSDADFEAVRSAGYSDGEIAEIIGNVAINIFTNYFNNSAQTEIDFPKVALHKAA